MGLAQLLERQFGVHTHPLVNRLIAAAAAAALQLVPNDPNRLAFTVVNLSLNIIYLMLDNQVAANRGIRLDPNGGTVSLLWSEDFQAVGWEWWVLAPAGASALLCIEVVED